jgi:hypothetical protein
MGEVRGPRPCYLLKVLQVCQVLKPAGRLLAPLQIVQTNEVHGDAIDLITTPPGVDFETCYASRVIVEIDGVPVNFIGLDDLKRSKKASGRLQDLADLENLQ